MSCATWILAGALVAAQHATAKPAAAADRITLRDGSIVLGLVTAAGSGPRGSIELLVRRDWAEKHVASWVKKWDKALESSSRLAARQRRERLQAWRRERAGGVPADDRIVGWIDGELQRLDQPGRLWGTAILPVRLARGDVRGMVRQSQANARLLRLGWLCEIPDAETLPPDSLADAVETRGFMPKGDDAPSLSRLLPIVPEGDTEWLARRAATELAVDSDLRFIRYQDMVLPDIKGGQPLAGLDLSSALASITRLLDPGQARVDPLAGSLRKVGERGRVGAMVTRLDLAADLGQVTVETTLWVRTGGDRWVPFVARSAAVRPDEVAPDAGQRLAGDPQVGTAFALVESLGLGAIPPELKERSLRMGAATEKALGTARSVINQDLQGLTLPIFEGGNEALEPGPARDKQPAPGKDHLGPRRGTHRP
jgi:hypothetical protein